MLEGYNSPRSTRPGSPGRNLMGFMDGTANLDPADDALMDRCLGRPADGEPGGSPAAATRWCRMIRMLVEFWDRTRLAEQEALFGRRKVNGAPLDGDNETDVPDFAGDPNGERTPLDAHIRLANPRTPATDQLASCGGASATPAASTAPASSTRVCLRLVPAQHRATASCVQSRLDGEPLEEYIRPEGGGSFFALPGVPDGYLGQGLFA